VLSEALGTFVLVFVILYIAGANLEDTGKTPIGLGSIGARPVTFLVWGIGLALGGTTGYAINPVRDLGPRIMHQLLPIKGKGDSDWGYAWVPIVGPILGALVAAGLFLVVGN
jgi:glycerol uptake facilitator protein